MTGCDSILGKKYFLETSPNHDITSIHLISNGPYPGILACSDCAPTEVFRSKAVPKRKGGRISRSVGRGSEDGRRSRRTEEGEGSAALPSLFVFMSSCWWWYGAVLQNVHDKLNLPLSIFQFQLIYVYRLSTWLPYSEVQLKENNFSI